MIRTPTSQALLAASGAALAVLALSGACGSTTAVIIGGDFASPAGIAVAPARDRDLVFVANTGGNELRVISICNKPSLPDRTAARSTGRYFGLCEWSASISIKIVAPRDRASRKPSR